MTQSNHTKSAILIRRIIDFHHEKSQALSLTKLYQLLYLIDFGHYALYGEAASELEYLRYGRELISLGAAEYIQLCESKEVNMVSEPAATYAVPNNRLSDTTVEVVEKTLTRLCEVSEEEIGRIIGYHHTWIFARGGKILKIDDAGVCDFEWLDYFSQESTREEYEQLEQLRRKLENSERMKALEARLKQVKV